MASVTARLRYPLSVFVAPRQEIQIRRRALVAARDVHQVAQIYRAVRRRYSDDDVADCLRIREQAGWIDHHVLRSDFQRSGRQRDVLRAQNIFQLGRIISILRQSLLRVIEVDLLRQHPDARDFRSLRNSLQGALQQVGVVIEIVIRVFRACNFLPVWLPCRRDRG